jgi:hypothetical protein
VINNILDAIREGWWDYEPQDVDLASYDATSAMPGSDEKIAILAKRAADGLPLWHDEDRLYFDAASDF